MTIDETHAQYERLAPVWRECRDAVEGQKAIQKGAENYLPKDEGQSDKNYEAMVKRAYFYNASGRTVDALQGLVFRKDPVIDLGPAQDWMDDINASGLSLEGFAKQAIKEVLEVNRMGILVEMDTEDNAPRRNANDNLLPYLSIYTAENILNWTYEKVGRLTALTRVVLQDSDGNNGEQRIRELLLEDGKYFQIFWERTNKDGKWKEVGKAYPRKGGAQLTEIPFYFLAREEPYADCKIENPLIYPLVCANIAHYQIYSDYKNALHLLGRPMPYVTGVDDEEFTFVFGSNGLILPNHESQVDFLQIGSEGLSEFREAINNLKDEMAKLGEAAISNEKKQAETAEAQSIKRASQNSILASLAGSVEEQIRKALQFMLDWHGFKYEVIFTLNKDYLVDRMSSQELKVWNESKSLGHISARTHFEGLKSGELINEDLTYEEELERREEDGPALGNMREET